MPSTLAKEIMGVRAVLDDPLPQSPSADNIIQALEEVYQWVTNRTNNTGNSWQVDTYTLTTVANQRVYDLTDDLLIATVSGGFYKPLIVTTIPDDTNTPEVILEFTELESLPHEWAWLSANNGNLYFSSHSGRYIAFYRQLSQASGSTGERLMLEIRPTPSKVENYKILYQVGNWWDRVFETNPSDALDYRLPHQEYRFHLRRLAARTLLPRARWTHDEAYNDMKRKEIALSLQVEIDHSAEAFEAHIASLDQADVIRLDSWADDVDPYVYPVIR